jgi:hypothetical protein
MEDIKEFKHTFDIMGSTRVVLISRIKGLWKAEPVTKGSVGVMSGGQYKALKEYIDAVEQQHRYCFFFYGSGGDHKYAKSKCG